MKHALPALLNQQQTGLSSAAQANLSISTLNPVMRWLTGYKEHAFIIIKVSFLILLCGVINRSTKARIGFLLT